MRPPMPQRIHSRLNHIARSIEIRLADFKMDDVPALLLQRAGASQNFKSGFRAKPRHPAGQMQFELSDS